LLLETPIKQATQILELNLKLISEATLKPILESNLKLISEATLKPILESNLKLISEAIHKQTLEVTLVLIKALQLKLLTSEPAHQTVESATGEQLANNTPTLDSELSAKTPVRL
jgi:hypothetical protein